MSLPYLIFGTENYTYITQQFTKYVFYVNFGTGTEKSSVLGSEQTPTWYCILYVWYSGSVMCAVWLCAVLQAVALAVAAFLVCQIYYLLSSIFLLVMVMIGDAACCVPNIILLVQDQRAYDIASCSFFLRFIYFFSVLVGSLCPSNG